METITPLTSSSPICQVLPLFASTRTNQPPACVCGRNPIEIPKHKVSLRHFAFLDRDEVAVCAATLLRQSCFLIFFICIGSQAWWTMYFNGGSLTQYKDYRWDFSSFLSQPAHFIAFSNFSNTHNQNQWSLSSQTFSYSYFPKTSLQ